jgi:hypothetical protein
VAVTAEESVTMKQSRGAHASVGFAASAFAGINLSLRSKQIILSKCLSRTLQVHGLHIE